MKEDEVFTMRFDMRAPADGVPSADLYSTALDMCGWAEKAGCLAVVLCEHHGSEDGYLPTPLILASAISARTSTLLINLVVLLPLYEPVRLAEEMVVLDIISHGRASYVFGLGYRPEEYEQFGLNLRDRGRLADEKLALLRTLLTDGTTLTADGRRITVTPRPRIRGGPTLMWGGGSLPAARRAGRYGLAFLAQTNVPGMQEAYEGACQEHGHEPGPTLLPPRDTASACFVADDVDQAWEELGPYLLHDARTYAQWNPGNQTSAHISPADTVEQLRATSNSHKIFGIEEAVDFVRAGNMLNLVPLCGGIPPATAWPHLHRLADVAREVATAQASVESGSGELSDALQKLTHQAQTNNPDLRE
jgi:alkanesulfonate monooxygenase SsuD/methylene tetrahydromethanopterin reductase-like flavin-dependent oxidoreductase (luciferase family)